MMVRRRVNHNWQAPVVRLVALLHIFARGAQCAVSKPKPPPWGSIDELAEYSKRLHGGRIEPVLSTSHQTKIEHFIVLLKENRAFDHIVGCMDLPGADSAATMKRNRTLLIDPDNPSRGGVNVTCGTANYVCEHGPPMSLWSQKFPPYGAEVAKYPYSPQSDDNAYSQGASGNAIEMFSPDQLPVKTALAKAFGVHNKLFTSVPSASSPNHMFSQSATSCGLMQNVDYSGCNGGSGQVTFPQLTVYDSMVLHNKTIKFYINWTETSTWIDGNSPPGEARTAPCSYATNGPGMLGGSEFPDVCMDGIARHKKDFMNYSSFFRDAAEGALPNFAMVLPNGSRSDHPCADIAHGERLEKDIYEALRAGPAWNKTLFLIIWDDIGGFYDHVVPPYEGVPSDESKCHVTEGCPDSFDFRRLGGRVPAFVVSPWVAKGAVFQQPKSKIDCARYASTITVSHQADQFGNSSQFELSSIPATAKSLFNLTNWLTKRDEWAGSMEELLDLPTPSNQGPLHLPDAPPGYEERNEQSRRRLIADGSLEEAVPQHCSRQEQTCNGIGSVTTKQRRKMTEIATLTVHPLPDMDRMTFNEADAFLAERFADWMRNDYPRY